MVDIGERLNIVPVIDEYIVENAIVSLPFGASQIRDSLKQKLQDRNNGVISFKSPIEHIILRNIVEQVRKNRSVLLSHGPPESLSFPNIFH